LTWGLNETDDWAVGAISIRPSVVQCGAGTLNAVGLRISDGSDSQISTTTEALAIHAAWLSAGSPSVGPVGSTYNVAASGLSNVSRIDFGGDTNAFAGTLPYPGIGTVGDESFSDFLVHSSGTLSLAAGNYTIFVESDDGFSLVMDTVFGGTVSFNKFGGSAAGASNELRFEGATSNARTGGSFTLTQDSVFDITAIFFERGGQDYMEVSIANGLLISETPADYEILRDGALSNAVKFGECLPPTPALEYRFDEPSWDGTANEVIDNSGNNNNGTALGGITTTTGKICLAADIPSNNSASIFQAVDTGVDLDTIIGSSGTISLWYKSNTAWNSGSDNRLFDATDGDKYFVADISSDGRVQFFFEDGSDSDYQKSTVNAFTVGAGVWKHLTFVWDIPSNTAKIFVDGVDQALSGNDGGTTAFSGYQTLYFGDNRSASYFTGQSSADGLIDEALVFDSVLTSAQIQTIFTNQNAGNNYDGSTRVCPGPTIDYFTIDHDNSGINCLAEPVSVTARNADATITTGYTGTITLDTQPLSTTGTWELVTGAGVFVDATANDGEATYTFDATDNGVAAFTLYYPEGEATFDIDVFDGAIRDDDSENDITFAANGFTITASELTTLPPNDPILTQIAGTEFAVYITAFGELPNDGDCGIIETYAGNKNLALSTAYENPNSGTVNILSSGLAAVTLNFSSGKANLPLNIKYKDVGAVQVGIIEPTFTDISYSNTFVVKPDRFQIAITGVQTATVATDPNVFTTAGSDFTVTVTALDAEGSVTESYGNETSPLEETISVTHSLVAPSLGSVGVLNNVNFENKGNGIFSGDFNWSEVGIIDLTAAVGDGNYLGAGNVVNTFENLGRFTPAYFEVLITNNGIFENKCLAGVGFTYIGENFSYSVNPAFSVTAKNAILPSATTTTTTNYRGAFAKLSLLPFVASGASISVVLNDTSNVGTEGSLLAVDFTAGIVSVDEDPVNFGVVNYRLGSDLYRY
jgi:hypothetical protein